MDYRTISKSAASLSYKTKSTGTYPGEALWPYIGGPQNPRRLVGRLSFARKSESSNILQVIKAVLWVIFLVGNGPTLTEPKAVGSPDIILTILENIMPTARPRTTSTTTRPAEPTRTGIVVEEAVTTRTNATTVVDGAEEAVQPEFTATIPVQAGVENDTRPTVRTTRYPQIDRTEEGKEPNGVDPETGTAADGPVGKPKGPPCPVFRPRRRWRRN